MKEKSVKINEKLEKKTNKQETNDKEQKGLQIAMRLLNKCG